MAPSPLTRVVPGAQASRPPQAAPACCHQPVRIRHVTGSPRKQKGVAPERAPATPSIQLRVRRPALLTSHFSVHLGCLRLRIRSSAALCSSVLYPRGGRSLGPHSIVLQRNSSLSRAASQPPAHHRGLAGWLPSIGQGAALKFRPYGALSLFIWSLTCVCLCVSLALSQSLCSRSQSSFSRATTSTVLRLAFWSASTPPTSRSSYCFRFASMFLMDLPHSISPYCSCSRS